MLQRHTSFARRIPTDFPWPKLDRSSPSRLPLNVITNRTHRSIAKTSSLARKSSPAALVKTEMHVPVVNSTLPHQHCYQTTEHNSFHESSTHSLPNMYPDPLQVSGVRDSPSSGRDRHTRFNSIADGFVSIVLSNPITTLVTGAGRHLLLYATIAHEAIANAVLLC